jgi:hypothetical protein
MPPTADGNVQITINASDFNFPYSGASVTFTILGSLPIIANNNSFEVKREKSVQTKPNGQALVSLPLSSSLMDSDGATDLIYHVECQDAQLDFNCRITESTTLLALYNARL